MAYSGMNFASKVKGAVRKNFNQSAEIYRSFEEKTRFFYLLTVQLARWMGIKNGDTVLDVGCGNGASCVALRECCEAIVYGVDLSEAMIADAHRRIHDTNVHLMVADGENLPLRGEGGCFDAVMYNTSLFVFPNPLKAFLQVKGLLKPGGVIGFSFYPRVYSKDLPDLISFAYERLGLPLPRFRTITSWEKACCALETVFGPIDITTYEMRGSILFLVDFFSIPAQSASLFPKHPYEERTRKVRELFKVLGEWEGRFTIGWDMARARSKRP